MKTEDELKKWVKTLTPSEKRFTNLIGKARSGRGSQLLDLFEWLNKAGEDELVPVKASFRNNLPTLATRLRELILDSLRLLNKGSDIDATLRSSLDEIAIMYEKKHLYAASRQLRKTKKIACETSRYTFAMQCIELEFSQISQSSPEMVNRFTVELREEEEEMIKRQRNLRELRFRHDSLLRLARQFLFSRDPAIVSEAISLGDSPLVHEQYLSKQYFEEALAVNILGVLDIILRKPESAIERYRTLLGKWKANEQWQSDQPELLMSICKNYQSVCLLSRVDPDIVHADLLSLKGINGLPSDKFRVFRETLFHHRFILSLNTGKLDIASAMIPEIEDWLNNESAHLTETQVLPFLCNFSVTEFLIENFVTVNKFLTRILNMPNRKARTDIREFAKVLQIVVHYERGNTVLSQYLTRSVKRSFTKSEIGYEFEQIVLRNISQLMNCDSKQEKKSILSEFLQELEALVKKQSSVVPLLGLNEIYMWALSRKNNVPLREIFMREVEKSQAMTNK